MSHEAHFTYAIKSITTKPHVHNSSCSKSKIECRPFIHFPCTLGLIKSLLFIIIRTVSTGTHQTGNTRSKSFITAFGVSFYFGRMTLHKMCKKTYSFRTTELIKKKQQDSAIHVPIIIIISLCLGMKDTGQVLYNSCIWTPDNRRYTLMSKEMS